jgi:CBS domain containing-hemolysin-like protein
VLPTKLVIVGKQKQGMSFTLRVSTKRMGNLYTGEKQLMKREVQNVVNQRSASARYRHRGRFAPLITLALLALPARAHASLFHGETLDSIANAISWVVLVVGPIIFIAIFWLVHILPEKIAHKKMHPQTRAIQCLCLLSLCFGGLLWPIAWLWAYTKPVLHKMAYGTDVDESLGHHGEEVSKEENEIEKLRARLAELEAKTRSGRS